MATIGIPVVLSVLGVCRHAFPSSQAKYFKPNLVFSEVMPGLQALSVGAQNFGSCHTKVVDALQELHEYAVWAMEEVLDYHHQFEQLERVFECGQIGYDTASNAKAEALSVQH